LLAVRDVTHVYARGDGRTVLDHVSLDVAANDIVAVVGESGCGKTTLGKVAAGLIRPARGHVVFDGRDVWSFPAREYKAWRPSVQLIHQDPYSSLNPGLTIGAVLTSGLLRNKLSNRHEVQERVLSVLRQVGLDDTPEFMHRYPHQLSGGQRQRVAVARTLSLGPRLIVADEVTSMLDVSMRVAILDLLLSFRAERAVAYVFISHDFGVVRYFAQGGRVVVMFYGVVVEEGPTEEVIRSPRHPYTWLLLQSLPVPDPAKAVRGRRKELAEPVEGAASRGCVFSNRCPFADVKCHESRPALAERGEQHYVACYFPERVPLDNDAQKGGEQDGKAGSPGAGAGGAHAAHHVVAGPLGRAIAG
jgi:oligopeptide/dipeptide ABC transporter ATP-binding protein